MADDGMLLNFELPSNAFAPIKTFKGGSWKDRLTAKKSTEYGRKKALERAAGKKNSIPKFEEVRPEYEELILPGSEPTKRARVGERQENRAVHHPANSRPRPKTNGSAPHHQRTEKDGFVSSLFTFNPKSEVVEADDTKEDDQPIEPSNAPLDNAIANFTSIGLSSALAGHLLKKLDLKAPTAIQRKAIQQLCATHADAFIQAETGSGKTLAYLLPIMERLMDLSRQMTDSGIEFNRHSGLFAIILSPTRELSKQINAVVESLLACCHWIVAGTVIGGEKKKSEKARLRKGINILVATPGRLADHLDNTEVLDVSKVRWLVLDEGDRLMELGFEKDIQKIVSILNLRSTKTMTEPLPGLPERRMTVLCSATLKEGVEQLKNTTLKEAASIAVDPSELEEGEAVAKPAAFTAPAQLKQSYVLAPAKQRLVALTAALRQAFKRKGSVQKCILFISCADSVDFHFEVFTRKQGKDAKAGDDEEVETPDGRTQGRATAFSGDQLPVRVFRLHGSLQQATRTSTLLAFTKCTDPAVLICTDVASRGLDLPNIDLVIEYDPPFSKDDHIHRIGRTARAGNEGRAMVFLMPGCEEGYVEVLKDCGPRNPTRHDADEILKKGFSPSSGVVSELNWQNAATDWQIDIERWALGSPKVLEQARRGYQSHIRAYATHVAAERSIFDMKQLHLGHLAKAFALRDKPASIRVPGLRPGTDDSRKTTQARRAAAARNATSGSKRSHEGLDIAPATDEQEGRKRMQAKMRAMGGASEFNLG